MRKFLDKYKNHIKDNEIFKNVEKACKTYELSKIQEKNFSTCFLNPVEYEIFISFLKEQNVRYVVFDENGKNERKSVLFLYEKNYDLSDFYSVFKCIGDFKQVSHRDVLGSLTALGLERNDVGDIFIYDDFCEFAVLKSSSKDIYKKLFSIKNINVETLLKEDLIFSEVLETVKEKILIKKYVSSLRMDNILSSILNFSRSEVKKYILKNKIKLNYIKCEKLGTNIEVGDYITVSGFGKYKFIEIKGYTKKGNYIVIFEKL